MLHLILCYADVDTSIFDFSEDTDYVISIGSYHMLLWMKSASNLDATAVEIESTKVLGMNKELFEAGNRALNLHYITR